MRIVNQLLAFVRRDFLLAAASRLTFAWQLVAILFAAPTLYYLGRLMQPAASPDLRPYGGDYFAFVILGIAFSGFFSAMMGAWAGGIRNEYTGGTLDAVLVSPVSLVTAALGGSLWSTFAAAVQTSAYLLVGRMLFHVSFAQVNVGAAAAAMALTMLVFAALGMLSASLILAFRSGDPLTGVLAGISALVAGVFYPTSILSPALQRIAQWVPLTHSLQALRLSLLTGAGIGALQEELVSLFLFVLVLTPLASFTLHAAVHLAKRLGTTVGQ